MPFYTIGLTMKRSIASAAPMFAWFVLEASAAAQPPVTSSGADDSPFPPEPGTDASTSAPDGVAAADAGSGTLSATDEELLRMAERGELIVVWDERPDKPFDRDTEPRLTGEELLARGATDLATALA